MRDAGLREGFDERPRLTLAEWMGNPAYYAAHSGTTPPRSGARHATIAPYGPFGTADGTILLVVQNDREWRALCSQVLDDDTLADDERFATTSARVRVAHRDELEKRITGRLSGSRRRMLPRCSTGLALPTPASAHGRGRCCRDIDWTVSVDSTINRAHQHGTNTTRPTSPQGAGANHKNPAPEEPDGHAIGRSRGGLGSKVHAAVDGNGMPLAIVLTGGQRHDGAMLVGVLDDIRVPRQGPGRPRTRPDAVVTDKAYSSGKTRRMLAARSIKTVIPQKSDEIASRKKKGSR